MAIETGTDSCVCQRCGVNYSKKKDNFYKCYSQMTKGTGYMNICKKCVDDVYSIYLAKCSDPKLALRQTCRKLDLYWNEEIYKQSIETTTPFSVIGTYITKVGSGKRYIGMSYDDTLINEGSLWTFGKGKFIYSKDEEEKDDDDVGNSDGEVAKRVPKRVVDFWGKGYSAETYNELEQRKKYYMSRLPQGEDVDIGTEVLIKQICNLEITIARDSSAGKSIDKSVNALNTLIGSLNLKPSQKKDESDGNNDNTPFGVWIKRFEDEKPIPEPDPDFEDADGIIKYMSIWFMGHLSKMLGLKNTYSKLYEDEIQKFRVEKPEYEDDDDETVFNEVFGGDDGDGEVLDEQ